MALALWLAMGWPFIQELMTGNMRAAFPVPPLWLAPYALFGAFVLAATFLKARATIHWAVLGAQLASVVAMTVVHPKDLMAIFLVIIAWQVAMATGPAKALSWVAVQTGAIIVTLLQAPNAHLSYIMALSLVLQFCCILIAQALRTEAEASRALAQTNRELRAAQAIIANNARNAERLRISRELHDAWGHELTALGLQLEIASNVTEPGRANDHVVQAKGLSRALLAKVRDVVAALRTGEGSGSPDGKAQAAKLALGNADVGRVQGHEGRGPESRYRDRQHWIFCIAAVAVSLALGWPVLQSSMSGTAPVPVIWFVSFGVYVAAVLGAILLKPRPTVHWALLGLQLSAVVAMAFIASWAMMSAFLVIIAWQVAMRTGPIKALAWVVAQTAAVVVSLAVAPTQDLCWVIGKSFALQLFFVFAAQALRMEAETTRALVRTNDELRAAQAIIANTVRDAERLNISRELHDAWGHELTALGLQLEIASHVGDPAKANDHVRQAKSLASALLAKVRDVVATLRDAERCDLNDALETLARTVPRPAIHVGIDPGVEVTPDQAHALIRCAQEAVTNAVKHAQATNLWLRVTPDGDGVRLVARNDGPARPAASTPGSGLVGMRERVESLGGKLAVRAGAESGFTVDAWLPVRSPQLA